MKLCEKSSKNNSVNNNDYISKQTIPHITLHFHYDLKLLLLDNLLTQTGEITFPLEWLHSPAE